MQTTKRSLINKLKILNRLLPAVLLIFPKMWKIRLKMPVLEMMNVLLISKINLQNRKKELPVNLKKLQQSITNSSKLQMQSMRMESNLCRSVMKKKLPHLPENMKVC